MRAIIVAEFDTRKAEKKLSQKESSLYEKLLKKDAVLSVIGLGYVGLPLAVAFDRVTRVIGFDANAEKVALYKRGIDPTREAGDEVVAAAHIDFITDASRLREARFHIVAVPTPINQDKTPDLSPVLSASRVVGQNLQPGSVVVYESTVYPGVTEDVCVPMLERESGLRCGVDFKVGYSPERINPGDQVHRLHNIRKVVSGMDAESLEVIAKVYETVIEAGVHRAPSIKVAEAAKVVENSQRDINIAFMNELAMVFDRMGIDTHDVVQAMNTKWNALGFTPGLVGGHCIGVDPYYFVYQAENLGYHSQIILAGRKINDGMGDFVADATIQQLALAGKRLRDAKVYILGLTFKENCPDIRNSKIPDIIAKLRAYGIQPMIVDPEAEAADVLREYGIALTDLADVRDADCLVFAVKHAAFEALAWPRIDAMFADQPAEEKVIIDVKSMLERAELEKRGYRYWRL